MRSPKVFKVVHKSKPHQHPNYFADARALLESSVSKRHQHLRVEEYPFDGQLLAVSPLYRKSREFYADLGGVFQPRVCSVMRSLSATDLFEDRIEYTPSEAEVVWLTMNHDKVFESGVLVTALEAFNGISLFHEQNHRVVWRLLPKVPRDQAGVIRYLNFAESLVVTLDLALGDEIGAKLSPAFERMKAIYRPAGDDKWAKGRGKDYRTYLKMLFYVTYLILAGVDRRDIKKCVDYVFPNQLQMAKCAVTRGLDLSELFTQTTNREWQRRFWRPAQLALSKLQSSAAVTFQVAADPLDFENEFALVNLILDAFDL